MQTLVVTVNLRLVERATQTVIVGVAAHTEAAAHPTDSRLLEVAFAKIDDAAKAYSMTLKQSYAKEGRKQSKKGPANRMPKSTDACTRGSNVSTRFPGTRHAGSSVARQCLPQSSQEALGMLLIRVQRLKREAVGAPCARSDTRSMPGAIRK